MRPGFMRVAAFVRRASAAALLGAASAAAFAQPAPPAPGADPPRMVNAAGGGRTSESRPALLEAAGVPVIQPVKSIAIPRDSTDGGATNGYADLAEGRWVGTYGFASCVGMAVLWDEDGKTRAVVSHFTVENDPEASIARFESLSHMPIPANAYAYVAGGSGEDDSNYVLAKMLLALGKRGVKVRSYSPFSSLWVDKRGELAYSPSGSVYADGWVSETEQKAASRRALDGERAARRRALGVMAQSASD